MRGLGGKGRSGRSCEYGTGRSGDDEEDCEEEGSVCTSGDMKVQQVHILEDMNDHLSVSTDSALMKLTKGNDPSSKAI